MALHTKFPKTNPEGVSVVKLSIGDKFFITKTSNILFLEEEIRRAFVRYSYRGGISNDNLYLPVIKLLHNQSKINDKGNCTLYCDVLFTSDNGYRVLQRELEYLLGYVGTKHCLNKNKVPYIPKTRKKSETDSKKWLTLNQKLNFYRLIKKAGL